MIKSRRNFLKALGVIPVSLGLGMPVSKEISLDNSKRLYDTLTNTDVIVAGGGPAGIAAAIACAKQGITPVLLENYGFFGGVAAWSMGMCMNQMRPFNEPRGFIHELLLEKLQNYGQQAVRVNTHQFWVNVEYLKIAILDLLDQFGVKYFVHTKVVDVIIKNNKISSVIISTKSGLKKIDTKVVVDCTGDADVAFFAGAPVLKEKEIISPQTLVLNVGNIAENNRKDLENVFQKSKVKYPLVPDSWSLKQVSNSNFYYINHSGTKKHGAFDVTDVQQFTDAECISRRQVVQMVEAMREFGKGEFKNIELLGTGPQIGVRESRRIQGAYKLSEDDAVNGSKFEDAIAWRSGWLDIGFTRLTQIKVHQVPYRCIVPEKIDGLLAAGRCISTTHAGLSAGKSMGNCFATGHAAGIAAALSVKRSMMPRKLKVKEIQALLVQDEVDLSKGGETQERSMEN